MSTNLSSKMSKLSKDVVSLQSKENPTIISKPSSKPRESELESKIKKLTKYSNSYFVLLLALMITDVFKEMSSSADQKYIQSILHGEASDLATVDLFSTLTNSAAPIFGYHLDNFYPFSCRIGPYSVFACLAASLSMASVAVFPQSKSSFIALISINAFSVTFINVITQGLLVLMTKLDVEIFDLKRNLERIKAMNEGQRRLKKTKRGSNKRVVERDQIGIRLYMTYSIYSAIFKGVVTMLSGLIVDNIPIQTVYLISASPGLLATIIVLLFGREPKEKEWHSKSQNLVQTLKSFLKVFFSPLILLPAILKLITNMIPDAQEAIRFILINQRGWSFTALGAVEAVEGLAILLVVLQLKKLTQVLRFEIIFLLGTLAIGYSRLVEMPQMFPGLPIYVVLASITFQAVFMSLADLFTTIPLFGRFNTLIPAGFESTGANIMNSLIGLGGPLSLYGTKKELQYFRVVNGYYGRLKQPLALNLMVSVIICFVCPLFLTGRVKLKSV